MRFSRLVFVGILIQHFCIFQTRAQQSPDSLLYKASVYKIHQVYLNEIGDNAQIYHGSEFIRNGQKANGFPFYESGNILIGSVSYQGEPYSNQNLYYNLVSDELITNNYAHNAFIVLSPGKVDSFIIANHVFVPLTAAKSMGLEKDGYYDRLISGEPDVFAKREKRLVAGTSSEEIKYIQYNYYYIRYKNIFYAVDGEKSLLDILKNQEDLLKKYIRANKLNFKKNLENSLVLTSIYYSQLKH